MGREFPQGGDNVAEIHPFVAMTFFFASVAATMAVVTSLCGALSRKKAAPSSDEDEENKENSDGNIQAPSQSEGNNPGLFSPENASQDGEGFLQQPLPPPPGKRNLAATGAASYHVRSSSTASTSSVASQLKKLPASMSMRSVGNGIGTGMSSSRQTSKRDQEESSHDHHKKKDKKHLKHEDSIWKKTIILGEKCKVPDEDDEDTILYDEKGNRITTYHRKTTSFALSRQNSNVDHDPLGSLELGHKDETIKNAFVGKH